jgi:tRNA (guanine-N7-)-methyltransferase
MAPSGRPTHPPSDDRPRFREMAPEELPLPELNPFVALHLDFGPPLLPAAQAWPNRGRWHELFGREAPLHVEIGSGNGFFLAGLAERHPDWNVLGVEIRYKRVVLTARKLVKAGIPNAYIARYDAWYLDDLFEPGSLSGLYVNHPDPWPKTRHLKNRLVSRWFMERAASLLKPGGWLRVKSDYRPNVDQVAATLNHTDRRQPAPALPFRITGRSEDVITGPAPWPDDIETNYQSKFRRKGEPVYAIEVVRLPDAE